MVAPPQCNQLSVNEREIIERQLKTWLLMYHHAEVVRGPEKLPKDPPPQPRIVVSRLPCRLRWRGYSLLTLQLSDLPFHGNDPVLQVADSPQ